MTCWAGERLLDSSAPAASSFTRLMKLLTTLKLTSASRRARRISRAISSTSFSPRRPLPRMRVKIDSKRSDSESNMRPGSVRPGRLGGEERVDELLGIELDQVSGRLAHTDELDGDSQLLLDGQDDPALGRAVELGQDDPGHVDRLAELLGLVEPVLAGRGLDDQQHLPEGPARTVHDAAELLQLLHEVDLAVEPPRGGDQRQVGPTVAGG